MVPLLMIEIKMVEHLFIVLQVMTVLKQWKCYREKGFSVNDKDKYYQTAIHYAAFFNKIAAMELLL